MIDAAMFQCSADENIILFSLVSIQPIQSMQASVNGLFRDVHMHMHVNAKKQYIANYI